MDVATYMLQCLHGSVPTSEDELLARKEFLDTCRVTKHRSLDRCINTLTDCRKLIEAIASLSVELSTTLLMLVPQQDVSEWSKTLVKRATDRQNTVLSLLNNFDESQKEVFGEHIKLDKPN